MLLRLAQRNLWRRKRRAIATAMAIAFGLWLTVLSVGTRESTYQRLMAISAQTGFGNLTLAAPSFRPGDLNAPRIQLDSTRLAGLAQNPEVAGVMPRLVGEGMALVGLNSTGTAFMAIDPAHDQAAFNLFCANIKTGSCLAGHDDQAVVIGTLMAERLRTRLGQELIVTTTNAKGEALSLLTKVVGLFTTGNEEIDAHAMVLPLDRMRRELGFGPHEASYAAVYVKDAHSINAVFSNLEEAIGQASGAAPAVKIWHWQETQPDLAGFLAADQLMYRLMILFVGLIVASGIFTCMIMNVMERRRELGTVLALGMLPRDVFLLLMSEALVLGCVGVAAGSVAVAPFFYYLNRYGLDLNALFGSRISAGGVTSANVTVFCTLTWQAGLAIVGTLFAMTMGATLIPAVKAATTIPIKSIRD